MKRSTIALAIPLLLAGGTYLAVGQGADAAPGDAAADGEQAYLQNCAACPQPAG